MDHLNVNQSLPGTAVNLLYEHTARWCHVDLRTESPQGKATATQRGGQRISNVPLKRLIDRDAPPGFRTLGGATAALEAGQRAAPALLMWFIHFTPSAEGIRSNICPRCVLFARPSCGHEPAAA